MTAVSDDRTPSTTGDLLRAEGLVKHFPMRGKLFRRGEKPVIRAVDGVSFSVATGETLGLVGESGSGKSTVARLVLRLMPLTGGTVEFDGHDITKARAAALRELRPGMQLVFQDPYSSFDPQATVIDSVIEPLIATGVDRKTAEARASDLFDLCGLSRTYLNRYPRELSGGQLQRGGIARALMTDPKLVVMDEPVSALDVSTQGQVINLLQDLQDELRVSFLFIAHDLAVVRHVSHRIAVMYLGQLVEEGTAQEIYEAPRHPYTQALLSAIPVPNPPVQRSRLRIILKGEIPSPANPPSGCRFRTRCPYVMDVCATEEPEEYVTADGHRSKCHLHVTGPAPLAGRSVTTLTIPD